MIRWLIHIVINGIVLMAVAGYIPSFDIETVWAALGASVILALINVFLKPILIILTLPITLVTFGLFLIVINALILMLVSSLMGPGFNIDGFGTALLASICISILNMLIDRFVLRPLLGK